MKRAGKPKGICRDGRSKNPNGHYIQVFEYTVYSKAYTSLSCGARALLIELMLLYKGYNNGKIFLSARDAAARLGCTPTTACKYFAELRKTKFIKTTLKGSFNLKIRHATCYTLTCFKIGNTAATKDFMKDGMTDPPTRKNRYYKSIRRVSNFATTLQGEDLIVSKNDT